MTSINNDNTKNEILKELINSQTDLIQNYRLLNNFIRSLDNKRAQDQQRQFGYLSNDIVNNFDKYEDEQYKKLIKYNNEIAEKIIRYSLILDYEAGHRYGKYGKYDCIVFVSLYDLFSNYCIKWMDLYGFLKLNK